MDKRYLIIDAHQDLAWNMVCLGRDYTRSVAESRLAEHGTLVEEINDQTLLGWDAYQSGRIALVFSTLFAAPLSAKEGDYDIQWYENEDQAHKMYRQQLDAYHSLAEEHSDMFRLVRNSFELDNLISGWQQDDQIYHPVGLVMLMESADAVREPAEVELWWQLGVRIIGPAWTKTKYCGGTNNPGPLTKLGYALLEAMSEFNYTLDVSHMDEEAVLQSLDTYPKRVIASHSNAKTLLKDTNSNRFLSDRVIQGLLERNGVIGVVPYNCFLDPNWRKGDPRQLITLDMLVAQIDYICQMAGDALHVGIGSDFDGGFGLSAVPDGIDTIADLQLLASILVEKGYHDDEINAIFSGNWLRLLKETLPEN